ncbi:hypothetical protein TUN205_08409 [Pyrenophora tritici-repentis]|nr:hypothetical protein TUN205_08409 [Pyrenophora tritici-repentis]
MAAEAIPPPYVITAHDKRGLIVVTGAVVLAFVWSCFSIRIWLRLKSREWRSDDWWLAAATILDTVQTAVIFHLVDLGLGASQDGLSSSQLERIGKEGFTTQILYILVLLASKLSVLFLYLRLSPGGSHRLATWSLAALSGVWALASIILIATPCNTTQAYTQSADCSNRWPKWQAVAALDIFTECLIFMIAIQLVYSLHMHFFAKFLVVMAFGARLPVIAIAAIRLYYMNGRIRGSSYTFEFIVATQWQMGYAIMSSTITGMAPFLKPFDSNYVTSYKHSDQSTHNRHTVPNSSMDTSVLPPRRKMSSGGLSESYLMETLPSRRGSKQTLPERHSSLEHIRSTSTSRAAQSATMTADEQFCPTHRYRGHETEVWVGERSLSMTQQEMMQGASSGNKRQKLVIGKKKEFKIEVDRVSRDF